MNGITGDLRYALRALRKSPGYTALCVAALALGIGANGAIFSLVDTLMLRPLPYAEPERLALASLKVSGERELGPPRMPWSYPKLQTFAAEQRAFSEIAGFVADSANLVGVGEPERLQLEMVSPAYFGILGVRPLAGRTLAADDARTGAPVVALIGEGLWRRRFGGDRAVLGRTLRLNRTPVTVVGVVPVGFAGLTGEAELWVPATAAASLWYPEALTEVGNHYLDVVGRLRPGVTPKQLAAEMARVGALVAAAHPMPEALEGGLVWSAGATPLAEARRDPIVRRALLVLLAAVGSVLLIACVNLGSLALARAASRRRDRAIRLAVGASTGRLVRQSLMESLVLALAGAAAGLLVAFGLVRGLAAVRPEAIGAWGVGSSELYDLAKAGVDARVTLFCMGLAVATTVLFGIGPALASRRARLEVDLRAGGASLAGRGGHGGAGLTAPRTLLVALQMTLALVLLTGSGLLLRSLWRLQHVPLGFTPQGVLSFSVSPPEGEYDGEATALFHDRLVERLAALPGVSVAAVGTCAPAGGDAGCSRTVVTSVDGRELPRASAPTTGVHKVSPGFFRALRVPLLAGRLFDERDRAGAARTVIVGETAARRLWPGQDPIGRRLQLGMGGLRGDVHGEVVGVVADVRFRRLEESRGVDLYLPDAQAGWPSTTVFLRTEGDPLALVAAARATVRAVDRNLPIYRVRTLEEQLGYALSKARFGSLLLAAFAGLALALAALGVYGSLAQSVHARRREIGVRMALGADRLQVERLVLRQGMAVALGGALAGTTLSMSVAGALGSLLFEVPARDPLTLAAAPALLLLVAAAACRLPARRAASVDPTVVLRQD
jgi:predicted permease